MPFFGPPDIKKLEAKRDVNGLMRALGYKDSSVGRSAARALGRIGAAPEPLVARLADGNWNTTWHVEETLVALGASAVPAVVTALTGDSPKVRHSAARILGQIRSPAAVEPLIAALWDQDDVVRDLSAAALCNIAYGRRECRSQRPER
jgi:HEAT repeat protein